MGRFANAFGPDHPAETYVEHAFPEATWDTGEVVLNYAAVGRDDLPALLLVPGQTESWWGYEQALPLLAERFRVFAVDLRGQGRSTRTPGRYTLDNMGNDLVRFLDGVVGRPTLGAPRAARLAGRHVRSRRERRAVASLDSRPPHLRLEDAVQARSPGLRPRRPPVTGG